MGRKSSAVTKVETNIIEFPEQINGQANDKTSDTLDILNQMTPSPAKSKSKVPVIVDKAFSAIVDKALALYRALKDAESNFDIVKQQVIERGKTEYDQNKGLISSFKLQGTKDTIMVSFKNQFKDIPMENRDALVNKLNGSYDKFFRDVFEIKIKDPSISKIQEIMNLVGKDKFMEIFELKKKVIKVSNNMNTMQYNLPEDVRPFVEQYQGSIKE